MLFPPHYDLSTLLQTWVAVIVPKAFQPTYLPPTRFIVSPFNELIIQKFEKMVQKMDRFYSDQSEASGNAVNELIKGQIYAAFMKDVDCWARVIFKHEFDAVAVVVFLPDYGFFSSASRRSICHLDSPFKLLPYQAMSASLPIKSPGASGRWSDEAVSVFKKTVFDKLLVGRVSFYSYDSASFPPSSIQFSSLFAIDNKDVSQGSWKNPRFQIGPNDVSVDVISLMIEQCFAKKG